jgi:hypothetical protein
MGKSFLQLQHVTRIGEWDIRGMTQDKIHEQMKQLGLAGNAELKFRPAAKLPARKDAASPSTATADNSLLAVCPKISRKADLPGTVYGEGCRFDSRLTPARLALQA